MYSYGHHELFDPAVTNKEAHMIYGSMNKEADSTQATDFVKKKRSKISDSFPKLNSAVLKVTLGFRIGALFNLWRNESLLLCQCITFHMYDHLFLFLFSL